MTADFWAQDELWPRDFAGLVFLARAVRMAGRKAFGDEWNDADLLVRLDSPLPPYNPSLGSADYGIRGRLPADLQRRAWQANAVLATMRLAERTPPLIFRLPPSLNSRSVAGSITYPRFTEAEWLAASEEIERRNIGGRPAAIRAAHAIRSIGEACAAGTLRSFIRAAGELEPRPINYLWWSALTYTTSPIYNGCQLDAPSFGRNQINTQAAQGHYGPIFVVREDMERLLASFAGSEAAAERVQNQSASERSRRVKWLTAQLKEDRDYKRAWAAQEFGIPSSGSAMSSIWKEARLKADLPEKGNPGAPPKGKQTRG